MTSNETNTTECSLSEEEKYYLRTANLILRVAPTAVRFKFDNELAPTALQHTLNQARSKVLEPLKKKKVINQTQWNFMFPISGKASSTTFDLTLMICLIRHLTDISITDTLPNTTVKSEGAELSRLKYYRNKIAHSNDGILTDSQFNTYWTDISRAIVSLGGYSFQQKCDNLKVCKLDNNDREILTEIRNMERSHDPIPKGVQGIHIGIVEEWENQKIVETRAIKQLIHLIKKADTVVAVGSLGCGKSTSIQYVALMLHHQQGFDIVPVQTPDLILQYFNPDHRQVFVINDICGKSTIDMNLVNRWGSLSLEISKMLDCKTVKILSSCRTHIFQDRLFKNIVFMATAICNLTSDFCLTKSERMSIAKMYLTNEEVKKIQANIFEMYDFFPLLCNIFAKQTGKDVVAFFSNPVQIIIEDMQLLFNSSDQTTFATLFLFIAYNNDLHENQLSEKSGIKQVLGQLFDNFQLQSNLSFQVIKYEIEKLCEAYIKKSADTYSILHDKLFTIFVSYCGEHMFDLVLNIAHTEVVRDRFLLKRLITKQVDITKHFITIPESKETKYFERLLRDINDGFLENIFLNTQLKYKSFRQQLIKFLLDNVDIRETVNSLDNETLSKLRLSMVCQNFSDMLKLLLLKHFDVNSLEIGDNLWRTLLCIASENGFIDTAMILLEHNASPDILCVDGMGYVTSLFIATEVGNSDIVKLLLVNKANPNIMSKWKITPLYTAVLNGNVAVVKLLLSFNADPNSSSWGNVTPLFEASRNGHTGVVKLLLEYNADPNLRDRYNRIPLDIASEKGYTKIVSLLLEYKSEIDHRDEDNVTPLLRTLMANHTDTAKILLEYGADYNICNVINITPLFVALEKDNTEVVEMMLKYEAGENIENRNDKIRFYLSCKKGDITAVNSLLEKLIEFNSNDHEFNHSALHVACNFGHTDIVKILINQNCDINIRDKYGATPLFRSCYSGETDVVKLLLNHEANVNDIDIFGDTPVMTASMKGQTEIVRLLLKYKCDVNIRNRLSETALHNASRAGYTDIVKLLIKHTDDLDIYNTDKETALCVASRDGNAEIVHLLLQHHCDPDIVKINFKIPSLISCRNMWLHCLTLQHRCNTFCCNVKDTIPLLTACRNGHTQVVKLLLRNYYDRDICNANHAAALFISCIENKIHIVTLLLQHIYNVKERQSNAIYVNISTYFESADFISILNINKQSCLDIVASYTGNNAIVKLLLDYKADPNIGTPLCSASENGFIDIVNTLLENKADPNIFNIYRETPIHIAIKHGHTEIVQLLLKYKCNSNIYNSKNETPLFISASKGNVEIVKMLLKHKCDLNLFNKKHETPLFIAVACNHLEIVKLLLNESNMCTNKCQNNETMETEATKSLFEQTCDSNVYNIDTETPLFRASHNGNAKLVKLLPEKNSDPNICYNNNESLLCISSCYRNFEVVKLSIEHKCEINRHSDDQCTSLVEAVRIVELLLHHDCDVNIFNKENMTSLYKASYSELTKITQLLFAHSCKIEVCDTTVTNPLYAATCCGNTVKYILNQQNTERDISIETYQMVLSKAIINSNIGIVKLLMQNNCNSNICYGDIENPLSTASRKCRTDIVRLLLIYKFDPNICNKDNEMPLFQASFEGFSEIEELSLENKCDPNIYNINNETPLSIASDKRYIEIVRLLLEQNCDVDICNKDIETPLFKASFQGFSEIVELLLEHNCDPNICNKYDETPVSIAAGKGYIDVVRLLLKKNCDPNICNKDNETPLFIASSKGFSEIVELLLEYKCDPNMCNVDNETPLSIASDKGFTEIIRLLLKQNCDVNMFNNDRETPLLKASFQGFSEIVELLLEHDCDPNNCNEFYETALSIASDKGYIDIVRLLLKQNCDVNMFNKDKETPLIKASFNGFSEIVKLLLEHDCDPNFSDKYNQSPLHKASSRGHTRIVELLLSYNCSTNLRNKRQKSAFDVALNMGHTDIMALLRQKNKGKCITS